MIEPINVLGIGVIAAPGYGPDTLATAWRDGWTLPPAPTELAIEGHESQPLGAIPALDPTRYVKLRGMRPLSRASQLGCIAAAAALRFPEPLPFAADDVGVVLGTRWGSIEPLAEFDRSAALNGTHLVNPAQFPNVVVNAHAGYLGILFGLCGPNVTLCGASAGLEAIVHAADLLDLGRADAVLAGGVEALGRTLLHGHARAGLLDHDDPPGEGGALLLLSRRSTDRPVLARIVGWASATATRADTIETTRATVLRAALGDHAPETVETIWHAGRSIESFAALGIAPERVRAIGRITGDCQAATGAIGAALAVDQAARGAGPVLATAFPPIGVQSAILLA